MNNLGLPLVPLVNMDYDSDCGSQFHDFPNSSIHDTDCKSNLDEFNVPSKPIISESSEIDIYSTYNGGKYSSSYEYFTKPPVTYFIANENGELSKEISGNPVINEKVTLLNISSITKEKYMNFESKSSPMDTFFENEENNTIDIFIGHHSDLSKSIENKWLADRGIFNIRGHALIMSKCGELKIPVAESINITDDLLSRNDKSIIGEFYSKNIKKSKFNFGFKKCAFCKKYNKKVTQCFCKRRVYCNLRCMSADSKTHHGTRIHSGVFL